ncbi:Uncharacterised protein [Clostridium putrefaciens]|uniref:Uncharacterized protein n=1 Tax=Clostridium putrefaciens TaxID=99675 RepID=A0A381J8G4_9CLOT|nr:hypothetical protein [Clostridium putrefaciens]SUY47550.1 Uncharacterised protein [Clostridium putrefaciens]
MQYYRSYIIILLSLILTLLWAIIYKIPIRKMKLFKKSSVYVCGWLNIEKDTYLEIMNATYFVLFGIVDIKLLASYFNINIDSLFSLNKLWYGIFLMLMVFIVLIEITMLIGVLVIEILLKSNIRKTISNVHWIPFDEKYPMYTAIIRPCYIVVLESIFFYGILMKTLTINLYMPFISALIIVTVLFTLGKLLVVKTKEQAVIFGIWNLVLFFTNGLVLGYTGSLVIPIIIYFLSTSFWVFKH